MINIQYITHYYNIFPRLLPRSFMHAFCSFAVFEVNSRRFPSLSSRFRAERAANGFGWRRRHEDYL